MPSVDVSIGIKDKNPRTIQAAIGIHQTGLTLNIILSLSPRDSESYEIHSASNAEARMLTGGFTLFMLTPNLGISV